MTETITGQHTIQRLDEWERFVEFLARSDAYEYLQTEDVVASLIDRSLIQDQLDEPGLEPPAGSLERLLRADKTYRAAAPMIFDRTQISLFRDDEPPSHWWWKVEELVLGQVADDLLDVPDAARLKGVHQHTIRSAVRSGALPARRLARGFLIRRRDLERWEPRRVGRPRLRRDAEQGDALLDAFNEANTGGNLPEAHRVAEVIAKAPSSPRRRLALAIDSYNLERFADALGWLDQAEADSLPSASREAAVLVRGLSMVRLKRYKEAREVLEEVAQRSPSLRSKALSGLAEASMNQRRMGEAWRIACKALEEAPSEPAVRFLAARVAFQSKRMWDALQLIQQYRLIEPADIEGALLHGSVLGSVADRTSDDELYRRASRVFWSVRRSDCRALRGYGLSLARLGRWRVALATAARVASRSPDKWHQRTARLLVNAAGHGALHRLGPDEALAAMAKAEQSLGETNEIREVRALAYCQLGKVNEALAALRVSADGFPSLPTETQLELANGMLLADRAGDALSLLKQLNAKDATQYGLLLQSQAALRSRDAGAAKDALKALTANADPTSAVVRIAVHVLEELERSGEQSALRVLATQWLSSGGGSSIDFAVGGSGDIGWEGAMPHPGSTHDALIQLVH